jgi:hypothetical protein
MKGYAVVTSEGYFIGIWKSREIAEKMCNRPPAKDERVVLMEEARGSEVENPLSGETNTST